MTQPGDHIADQDLSTFIDDQLSLDELRQVKTHVETCASCTARLGELRSLVDLLHGLASIDPPRDFSIGLRLLVDPPNVVRLRRWYAAVRVAAASVAAAFVFLSAGALYVGSKPVPSSAGLAIQPQLAAAPAAPPVGSPPAKAAVAAAPPAPVPSGPSVPAPNAPGSVADSGHAPAVSNAAGAAAPPLGPAGTSSRSGVAPTDEVADQVTAATSVRPLPTPVPTVAVQPTPAQPRLPLQADVAASVDSAAPLRTAAASAGLLAAFGLLVTLFVRRRLRAAIISSME